MTDLDQLRALLAKATRGKMEIRTTSEADFELALAAVNALPELLDRLEAAERDAAKWRAHDERKRKVIAAGMGKNPLRDSAREGAP